jgi:hypothetical protein
MQNKGIFYRQFKVVDTFLSATKSGHQAIMQISRGINKIPQAIVLIAQGIN